MVMKESLKIKVASDFSNAPGARSRGNGPKSGEEFYESLLLPMFDKAVETDSVLEFVFYVRWWFW